MRIPRTPLHYWRITDKYGSARFTWKLKRIYAHDNIDKLAYSESKLLTAISGRRHGKTAEQQAMLADLEKSGTFVVKRFDEYPYPQRDDPEFLREYQVEWRPL